MCVILNIHFSSETFLWIQTRPSLSWEGKDGGWKRFPLSTAEVQFTTPPWVRFPPIESSELPFFTPQFPHYPFHFSILYVWSTVIIHRPSPTLGCNYSPLGLKQHNPHHLHLLFWVQWTRLYVTHRWGDLQLRRFKVLWAF